MEQIEAESVNGSDLDGLPSSTDEHTTVQSGCSAPLEERDYGVDATGESSSRSRHTTSAISSASKGSRPATDAREENFELKQRVNTFPKDAEGNILPVRNPR